MSDISISRNELAEYSYFLANNITEICVFMHNTSISLTVVWPHCANVPTFNENWCPSSFCSLSNCLSWRAWTGGHVSNPFESLLPKELVKTVHWCLCISLYCFWWKFSSGPGAFSFSNCSIAFLISCFDGLSVLMRRGVSAGGISRGSSSEGWFSNSCCCCCCCWVGLLGLSTTVQFCA